MVLFIQEAEFCRKTCKRRLGCVDEPPLRDIIIAVWLFRKGILEEANRISDEEAGEL